MVIPVQTLFKSLNSCMQVQEINDKLRQTPKKQPGRMSAEIADSAHLPFEDKTFDVVVCSWLPH